MCENENKGQTVEGYIRGLVPNAAISDDVINGVMVDAGLSEGMTVLDMGEREKDLSLAYLVIRLALNPSTSQRVTDKDADWEHSQGSEVWGKAQLQQFLLLARDLLSKWGIEDIRVKSLAPKWGRVGRGVRNRRRYRL